MGDLDDDFEIVGQPDRDFDDGHHDCSWGGFAHGDGFVDHFVHGFVHGFVDGVVDGFVERSVRGFVVDIVDGSVDGSVDGVVGGFVDGCSKTCRLHYCSVLSRWWKMGEKTRLQDGCDRRLMVLSTDS